MSRTAATTARGRAIDEVRRGEVRVNRDEFAVFWAVLLEAKHPYITAGTLQDYTTHGRKRLLPYLEACADHCGESRKANACDVPGRRGGALVGGATLRARVALGLDRAERHAGEPRGPVAGDGPVAELDVCQLASRRKARLTGSNRHASHTGRRPQYGP
jgi:hypothetical protein